MDYPEDGGDEEYDAQDEFQDWDDGVGVLVLKLQLEYLVLLVQGMVLCFEFGQDVAELPVAFEALKPARLLVLASFVVQVPKLFALLQK